MELLLLISMLMLMLIIVISFAQILVCKKPISKLYGEKIMNLNTKNLSLNCFDDKILNIDYNFIDHNFITTLPFPILFKYYINGVGVIWRWSRVTKRIDQYYKIAKENDKIKKFLIIRYKNFLLLNTIS